MTPTCSAWVPTSKVGERSTIPDQLRWSAGENAMMQALRTANEELGRSLAYNFNTRTLAIMARKRLPSRRMCNCLMVSFAQAPNEIMAMIS